MSSKVRPAEALMSCLGGLRGVVFAASEFIRRPGAAQRALVGTRGAR
jgi:hypothetical protein